jgi:hypothetical protein
VSPLAGLEVSLSAQDRGIHHGAEGVQRDSGACVSVSEEQIRRSVDEVMESAWPSEHRRASRRWLYSTLARAALGTLGFWSLALLMYLLVGLVFPWTFYAFVFGLTTIAALSDARDPDHLRRG